MLLFGTWVGIWSHISTVQVYIDSGWHVGWLEVPSKNTCEPWLVSGLLFEYFIKSWKKNTHLEPGYFPLPNKNANINFQVYLCWESFVRSHLLDMYYRYRKFLDNVAQHTSLKKFPHFRSGYCIFNHSLNSQYMLQGCLGKIYSGKMLTLINLNLYILFELTHPPTHNFTTGFVCVCSIGPVNNNILYDWNKIVLLLSVDKRDLLFR